METWRAIMTQGAYDPSLAKASRYGVLDDDADRLAQPLISRGDSDESYSASTYSYNYSDLDIPSPSSSPHPESDDDHDALEYGCGVGDDERDHFLRKPRQRHASRRDYDEIPLKPSPAAVLRSLVTNVLWPMTAVGAQTAKVFETTRWPLATAAATTTTASVGAVEDRNAMRSVMTLRAMIKPRRRAETVDEIHERALVRIAVATLVFSAWLIITVYRHAD